MQRLCTLERLPLDLEDAPKPLELATRSAAASPSFSVVCRETQAQRSMKARRLLMRE